MCLKFKIRRQKLKKKIEYYKPAVSETNAWYPAVEQLGWGDSPPPKFF